MNIEFNKKHVWLDPMIKNGEALCERKEVNKQ